MKELNGVSRNGYITSGLDLTVRARTVKGEIIAFDVEPEGTTASYAGGQLELPPELAKLDRIADLLNTLRFCGLDREENTVKMVNVQKGAPINASNACTAVAAPCAGFGCAGDACAIYTAPCGGDVCAGNACAMDGGACVAEGCAGNACAGEVSPCAGVGCAGYACAGEVSPCAGDGCAGVACAANVSPCAGQVCAGNACAVEALPCAGDAHVGPCIHVSYCPIIL